RQRQGGGAERRDQALEALLAGRVQEEAGEAHVVLDDQQHRVARADAVAVVAHFVDQRRGSQHWGGGVQRPRRHGGGGVGRAGRAGWVGGGGAGGGGSRRLGGRLAHRVRRGVDRRQKEGEGPPPARAADQADLAAQQPRQLAADRQAQAGAAVLAAGRAVGLLE